ncbi:hypothetical protein ACSTS3_19595 [Aquimarina muelleri]|uniref:hypothetical protein n=1 Tax=Aquimarina muelleri TaxID=279356 RepID=UPI003F689623
MKKLLFITLLLSFSFSQAQSVEEISDQYANAHTRNEDLKKGLELIKTKCLENPNEKCSKVKSIIMYLIADRYFRAANTLINLDENSHVNCYKKGLQYYNEANKINPSESLKPYTKNKLLASKKEYEEAIK